MRLIKFCQVCACFSPLSHGTSGCICIIFGCHLMPILTWTYSTCPSMYQSIFCSAIQACTQVALLPPQHFFLSNSVVKRIYFLQMAAGCLGALFISTFSWMNWSNQDTSSFPLQSAVTPLPCLTGSLVSKKIKTLVSSFTLRKFHEHHSFWIGPMLQCQSGTFLVIVCFQRKKRFSPSHRIFSKMPLYCKQT